MSTLSTDQLESAAEQPSTSANITNLEKNDAHTLADDHDSLADDHDSPLDYSDSNVADKFVQLEDQPPKKTFRVRVIHGSTISFPGFVKVNKEHPLAFFAKVRAQFKISAKEELNYTYKVKKENGKTAVFQMRETASDELNEENIETMFCHLPSSALIDVTRTVMKKRTVNKAEAIGSKWSRAPIWTFDEELKNNRALTLKYVECSLKIMLALGQPGARNMLNPVKVRCPLKFCRLPSKGLISLNSQCNLTHFNRHLKKHEDAGNEPELCKKLRARVTVAEGYCCDRLVDMQPLLDTLHNTHPLEGKVHVFTDRSKEPATDLLVDLTKFTLEKEISQWFKIKSDDETSTSEEVRSLDDTTGGTDETEKAPGSPKKRSRPVSNESGKSTESSEESSG